MRIVIVGAGIAGCASYLQLHKHLPKPPSGEEHQITIYEAYNTDEKTTYLDRQGGQTHSSTLVVGGGLGVAPNGLNVVKRLNENLLHDIVQGGYVVAHGNMKSKHGDVLLRLDSTSEEEPPMHLLGCSRHHLWKCLRSRIPARDIITQRVSAVTASTDGLNTVEFVDDVPPVKADLVIGADGLKSTVKRALFLGRDQNPYPPHYEGLVGVGGFIPADEVKDDVEKGSMNFVLGGNGFFGYFFADSASSSPHSDSPYHVSEPGSSLAWWSTYSVDICPDPKALDMDDVLRQLRDRHADWSDPVIQKVLNSLRVDSMYPTWTSPPLPFWERNGVVLVGDAAHALPPTSGQGSSQALEDVEALALFLRHNLSKAYEQESVPQSATHKKFITAAAEQYMKLRQPHVEGILKRAQSSQNSKRNMSWIEEKLMYWVMWLLGFWPSIFAAPLKSEYNYNVAEHADQVLATKS